MGSGVNILGVIMVDKIMVEKLTSMLSEDSVLVNEMMNKHCSFKIGGPADVLLLPRNIEEVIAVYRFLKQQQIAITWLGNGSNILVSDKGIRGAVIKIAENMGDIKLDGEKLTVSAGALLWQVSKIAAENSLTGFEFSCGIPGTIGGAAFMNAGAYGGEMKQVTTAVTALTSDGEVVRLTGDDLQFRYRGSSIQDNGYIVLEVELKLEKGDQATIDATIADLTERREAKQPLELPSAGSTFKRPAGYYAGKLIDDSNLRGVRFGDAAVSEKHCGFVVNLGDATCCDVTTLIKFIQKTVYDNFGVVMQTEVRMIGNVF